MALRPSSLMILLAYGALIILVFLTPCWYVMVIRMEKRVNLNSKNIVSQLQSEIKHSAELLHPMKSSSTNLAKYLSSALDPTDISFSDIESKVAPLLFQAFETVPYLAQISYIGMEGLFFTYYTDHDQALAMYSNSSSSWGASNITYIQPVNRETGEALNVSNGFASLGTKWGNDGDLLFLSSAGITRRGVISLGFSATAITDFVTRIDQQGTRSYLATKDGKVLVEGIQHTRLVISNDTVSLQSVNANGGHTSNEGTVSCKNEAAASSLNIRDTEYLIHCYTVDIMGIESVYVLAVPQNGFVSFGLNYKKKGLILFVVTMVTIFIAFFSFLFINCRATRREMHLCASLIKQCEATQQAEKKNMNKSIAFASASHDVRASLAGITGLIEISYELVVPGSELETNLKQMNDCTQDLLGLLNSILDTSKIEAGKMQLEEEEFDVFHLLEDVVDFYHPVAMKKGVDLVLDPCNGSVVKYSRVKGDRGKLKQVMCNLLSNAVKFTDEGHIAVRAWTQKPRLQNSTVTCNQCGFKKYLSPFFRNKNKAQDDVESMHSIQEDPHSMDFIFEVDDTGKGIPKENYKSVFENYVQVKETALGQGGTGLGLGIVQSLVRLMHGDIEIVEKDTGEKGTCFRFNVLLTLSESETITDGSTREGIECGSGDKKQAQGQTMHATSSGSRICSMSPRLHIFSSSPKPAASLVVLLIADEERQRTSRRFMERLGIKVEVVNPGKHLFYTLKKIKQKGQHSSGQISPGSSDLSSRSTSHNSLAIATRVPLSSMDGTEHMPLVFKKTDIGAAPGFILIVIDANAGPFSELYRIVSRFKKDLCNPCKVVWLDKPLMRSINLRALDQEDIVISKPFHGSRLFQAIKLLPEFGGGWQSNSSKAKREAEQIWKGSRQSKAKLTHVHQGEIQECGDSSGCHKPLSGKKFLVVDDSELLRKLASATLISLGATMEQCENGEQAVRLVDEGLSRNFPNPPYDYILMDCQAMTINYVMDGFEATKWVRRMEQPYGVRIPIIALTACTEKVTIKTGIDFHIVKPIKKEHLLEAVRYIHGKA
ncbi:Histidine kinase CKI1 [Spatholobus suberectus]|nr:Histidine kinase CKI1 [Spatholobus suberectus]